MVCRASGVAAAGAAVAFYFYSRRVRVCGFGGRKEDLAPDTASAHFEGAYQAPSTWMEALLFFAEALRYMYNESLGRWRTADLLIGLAYLARQESANRAIADIAAAGSLVGRGKSKEERLQLVEDFQKMAHFMKYCQALRERQPSVQTTVLGRLGIDKADVLMQQGFAGMLKPSYVLVQDHKARCIVLAIRGTHSIKDLFTSLTSASKPHHMLSESGVILGYSHFGMLAAARWVLQQTNDRLEEAMVTNPGYRLQIVGHSLGAGTAALLTTRLRETGGMFADATCLAIACPACMTMDLAQSCNTYVTTIINGHDMIPTLSPGAADALREEVMQSSWYEAFRSDMRSSLVVRAVEASVGGVGSVTSAATSWTSASLSSASQSLRACYQRRGQPALRRSGSDSDQMALDESLSRQSQELIADSVGNVEIARNWVQPEDDAESPSWAKILEQLKPLDQGRGVEPEPEPEPSGKGNATSRNRASWPFNRSGETLTGTSLPANTSRGSFWGRVWPRSCGVEQRRSPFASGDMAIDSTISDPIFDSVGSPPPMARMQMERHDSANALTERLKGGTTLAGEEAVEITAAEACASGAAESDMEPEIPSDRQRDEAFRERRMTYPAGRIYHLVPARLVFGSVGRGREQQDTDIASTSGSPELVHRAKPLKRAEDSSDRSSPFYEGVVQQTLPKKGEDPYVVISTNSLRQERGVAPPIPPIEDFVLLENVPQHVYGRIRLCSRMLADHFIPAYLGSMESALESVDNNYSEWPTPTTSS